MITIDDVTYTEDDLSEVAQMHVKRVNDLREESAQLGMMLEEKNVLISAYANAIRESLKEVEEVEEILEKSNKKEVIENKETHNNKSSNWFGVDDFKTNLDNFIKNICLDDNPSILDLKNSNYLIASDMYLHEINYFDKKFRIKNKIKLIDYKIVDLFGVTNLFTKEEIHGQDRITCFKIRNIAYYFFK